MNNNMNKWLAWLGILMVVIGGYFVWSAKDTAPANSQPIRVGAVLGLTGYAAVDSLNVKRGLDLAQEDLAKKGVAVVIEYQDDKTDAKQTVSALQYIVQNKPDIIIGPIWSFLEQAGEPVITQAKVVAFAPADTSEFAATSPYMFHGSVMVSASAISISQWLKERNVKKVAIITSKDGWGDTARKAFEEGARLASAEVVVTESLQSQSTDVSSLSTILTKIKSAKAEAILFTGYDEAAIALVKKRQELSMNIPILAQTTLFRDLLSRGVVAKAQLSGVDFLAIPTSADFIAKFKTRYGTEPGNYADRAYDGLMLLVEAVQKSPTRNGTDISNYVRTNTNYSGYGGVYKFDANGDLTTGEWIVEPVVR